MLLEFKFENGEVEEVETSRAYIDEMEDEDGEVVKFVRILDLPKGCIAGSFPLSCLTTMRDKKENEDDYRANTKKVEDGSTSAEECSGAWQG